MVASCRRTWSAIGNKHAAEDALFAADDGTAAVWMLRHIDTGVMGRYTRLPCSRRTHVRVGARVHGTEYRRLGLIDRGRREIHGAQCIVPGYVGAPGGNVRHPTVPSSHEGALSRWRHESPTCRGTRDLLCLIVFAPGR
jgi:hypothetical protein